MNRKFYRMIFKILCMKLYIITVNDVFNTIYIHIIILTIESVLYAVCFIYYRMNLKQSFLSKTYLNKKKKACTNFQTHCGVWVPNYTVIL